MPTFDNLLRSAPAGFSKGCIEVNNQVGTDPDSIKRCVVALMAKNADKIDVSKNCRNTVDFIINSFRASNPVPSIQQMASALDMNSFLNRESVEVVVVTIQENAAQPLATSLMSQQVSGKMTNFKWKIGLITASSKCTNISRPYVSISFDIREKDDQVSHHSAELTFQQFQEFRRSFCKALSVMESL